MQLARELVEKGEKEAVLQYLDLVSRFWPPPEKGSDVIAQWKREVAAGKVPTATQWR